MIAQFTHGKSKWPWGLIRQTQSALMSIQSLNVTGKKFWTRVVLAILLHSPPRTNTSRKRPLPDLYSVPPDPPCWGLLWIALLLLLRSQSQWGMCWHSAPRATEGLFNSMRSGITMKRRKLHSESRSAHDFFVADPNARHVMRREFSHTPACH